MAVLLPVAASLAFLTSSSLPQLLLEEQAPATAAAAPVAPAELGWQLWPWRPRPRPN
jgi:hypothetical protein